MQALGRAQHVETVGSAHLEIAHDDVEIVFVQLLDRSVAVACLFDIVTGSAEGQGQPSPQRVVIVCHKYSAHLITLLSDPRMGKRNRQRDTDRSCRDPERWRQSMRPSCASTILRTMARPRPDP